LGKRSAKMLMFAFHGVYYKIMWAGCPMTIPVNDIKELWENISKSNPMPAEHNHNDWHWNDILDGFFYRCIFYGNGIILEKSSSIRIRLRLLWYSSPFFPWHLVRWFQSRSVIDPVKFVIATIWLLSLMLLYEFGLKHFLPVKMDVSITFLEV
jgi:hypothetical protein